MAIFPKSTVRYIMGIESLESLGYGLNGMSERIDKVLASSRFFLSIDLPKPVIGKIFQIAEPGLAVLNPLKSKTLKIGLGLKNGIFQGRQHNIHPFHTTMLTPPLSTKRMFVRYPSSCVSRKMGPNLRPHTMSGTFDRQTVDVRMNNWLRGHEVY